MVPTVLAAVVTVVGALLVLTGGLKATVMAPPAITRATLSSPRTAVVSTAVGVLGLEGTRLEADVTSPSSRTPVFVGIGRAHDVDAYLAQVARREVIGDDGGRLLTRSLGTQAAAPDPAGVDVWVVSARGQGSASLAWPDAPGQWRMVIATNGTTAAAGRVTFTWSGRQQHSRAPALISVGLVLFVVGLITLVMLRSRSGLAGDDDEE